MRIIRNTTLQGFSVPMNTPEGIKYKFLGPKVSLEIPDNWSSPVAENLVRRRMASITHRADPTPNSSHKKKSN